jgi:hypothetical protein
VQILLRTDARHMLDSECMAYHLPKQKSVDFGKPDMIVAATYDLWPVGNPTYTVVFRVRVQFYPSHFTIPRLQLARRRKATS